MFEDDFESYDDFVLDFPPWIQFDGDGSPTYGMTYYDYPNEYYTGSFIIFNPSQTTPPCPYAPPHSGQKFAACFNAVLPATNDDWLITPQLGPASYEEVSFWARSYTDDYNLDRFQVGISTTDTNPSSFTIISPGNYIEAPITWTQYTYDISAYSGNSIYIAIHCVSYDAFILMVDDFSVTGSTVISEPKIYCEGNINWENVKAGSTVNATFRVYNSGDPGSLLSWKVDSFPTWGTWTFTPSSGIGLEKDHYVEILVQVVAPAEKKKTFTGKIKIINTNNESDFCEIDVTLITPRTIKEFTLLQWILQRYPNMFPKLRRILM
ncbi:MAG: choice-of-anchor J domain-containing protein [Thermoplasmatota archaeon]